MKKTIVLLLCLAMVFVVCGCQAAPAEESTPEPTEEATPEPTEAPTPEPTEEPTPEPTPEPTAEPTVFGEVQDGVYVNDVLGFSAVVPEDWYVATNNELFALMGLADTVADGLDTGSLLEQTSETDALLFYCSKYELGYAGLNPNIIIGIENKVWTPDYTDETIDDLQTELDQMYQALGWSCTIYPQENIDIFGVEYSYVTVETDMGGTMMYQELASTDIQDYTLSLSFTYFEEADMSVVSGFITNLTYR